MRVPLALTGCTVTRTAFDFQVRLLLAGDEVSAELVIETPFRLAGHDLEPGTGAALAPVLALFQRVVSGVEVRGRGELRLLFDDGAELRVPPHPSYESWHLSGRGVEGILVGPGGEDGWTR